MDLLNQMFPKNHRILIFALDILSKSQQTLNKALLLTAPPLIAAALLMTSPHYIVNLFSVISYLESAFSFYF